MVLFFFSLRCEPTYSVRPLNTSCTDVVYRKYSTTNGEHKQSHPQQDHSQRVTPRLDGWLDGEGGYVEGVEGRFSLPVDCHPLIWGTIRSTHEQPLIYGAVFPLFTTSYSSASSLATQLSLDFLSGRHLLSMVWGPSYYPYYQ